jgi:hypothetical protein
MPLGGQTGRLRLARRYLSNNAWASSCRCSYPGRCSQVAGLSKHALDIGRVCT